MNINDIENNSIDFLIQKEKLIILEFYTKWCPTCKMLGMVLEEYEEENDDVFIVQIDADEHKELANIYKIINAPTMIFFYHGKLVKIHSGFIETYDLEEIVKSIRDSLI